MGGSQQQVIQDTTRRYLKKAALQDLLEELFPQQKDFKIQVCPQKVTTFCPVIRWPAVSKDDMLRLWVNNS